MDGQPSARASADKAADKVTDKAEKDKGATTATLGRRRRIVGGVAWRGAAVTSLATAARSATAPRRRRGAPRKLNVIDAAASPADAPPGRRVDRVASCRAPAGKALGRSPPPPPPFDRRLGVEQAGPPPAPPATYQGAPCHTRQRRPVLLDAAPAPHRVSVHHRCRRPRLFQRPAASRRRRSMSSTAAFARVERWNAVAAAAARRNSRAV